VHTASEGELGWRAGGEGIGEKNYSQAIVYSTPSPYVFASGPNPREPWTPTAPSSLWVGTSADEVDFTESSLILQIHIVCTVTGFQNISSAVTEVYFIGGRVLVLAIGRGDGSECEKMVGLTCVHVASVRELRLENNFIWNTFSWTTFWQLYGGEELKTLVATLPVKLSRPSAIWSLNLWL